LPLEKCRTAPEGSLQAVDERVGAEIGGELLPRRPRDRHDRFLTKQSPDHDGPDDCLATKAMTDVAATRAIPLAT
jgi:hypothetical protein